jgi:hypothetical protein
LYISSDSLFIGIMSSRLTVLLQSSSTQRANIAVRRLSLIECDRRPRPVGPVALFQIADALE